MTIDPASAAHWDDAYSAGDSTSSWFQTEPTLSLRMLDAIGTASTDSIIDVGGGASPLTDALLDRGFDDLTVLDISQAGMRTAQQRIGAGADRVQWILADLLTWRPRRSYRIWHDRAVFHFLTRTDDQRRYLDALSAATIAGSVAIFGCFAPDGPDQCSGLRTARYSADDLHALLGPNWSPVTDDHEDHPTPTGVIQPLTWAAFRR